MILFLDYDGVLHPDPCFEAARLFERAPLLAEVVEAFAEVAVVLSTSWRLQLDLPQLVDALPASLRARVIGVTPPFSSIQAPPRLAVYRRQAECMAWLMASDRPDRPWLALDDRASLFEPYCDRLVACDSNEGLTPEVAARLRAHLSRARLRLQYDIDAAL